MVLETWIVMCPEWKKRDHLHRNYAWSLDKAEVEGIGQDVFKQILDCPTCGKKFSLHQGVIEAFASDITNLFFLYNSFEGGFLEVETGKPILINFASSFNDAPILQLVPSFVHAAPSHVTASNFVILCNSSDGLHKEGAVTWCAFGNKGTNNMPVWKSVMTNTKELQFQKNYRSEIIELESAIEVFFGEYLSQNLTGKLKQETIDCMFELSIHQQMKIAFKEVRGSAPKECSSWNKDVNDIRNKIVHHGLKPSSEEAYMARKATVDLLVKTDPTVLSYFKVNLGKKAISFVYEGAKIDDKNKLTVKFW